MMKAVPILLATIAVLLAVIAAQLWRLQPVRIGDYEAAPSPEQQQEMRKRLPLTAGDIAP